jgi:hypothetical protein
MKTRILILILAASALTACAGYTINGRLTTPFGSVSSDGRNFTIEADTRGFAK